MTLWRELRRRRVVSTAAAYAAAAFVLLQLGEILFPAFGMGPDALQALFWVLLALFPAVLAFSWVFDVTRRGLRRTAPAKDSEASEESPKPGRRHSVPPALAFTVGLTTSILLGAVGWQAMKDGGDLDANSSMIAVLPFSDRSPDGSQAYLGDGVAEAVMSRLMAVPGLSVVGRTSSFSFRGDDVTAQQIGSELGAGWFVEGSVQRSGQQIRVNASLVRTSDGSTEWQQTFDADSGDLFAVQDSIATSIVEAMQGRLIEATIAAPTRAVSAEAQDVYMRGRAEWNRRDATALPSAIRLFQEAAQIDSMFAGAYAGLADSYALLPQFVVTESADEAWSLAVGFAERAIELDPNLPEAHSSLGLVKAMRRDRVGAVEEFDRALELNPSFATARHWRANVAADLGRLDDALDDLEAAARLDPLSPAIAADYGNVLLWWGDLDGAQAEFDRAESLERGFGTALFGRALIALERGDQVPFLMEFTQWAAVVGVPSAVASQVANAARTFRDEGRTAPVPALDAFAESASLPAGTFAQLYALVGDREGVLRSLRSAIGDGSWVTQYLAVNSLYEPFRDDPEFLDILISLGG